MSRKSPKNPGVDLLRRQFGPVELDVCPQTGGLWLDGGELDQLSKWFSDGDAVDAHGKQFAGATSADLAKGPCPACGTQTLAEYKLPTPSGPSSTVLDICTSCLGIWVDGPEVAAVRATMVANVKAGFATVIEVPKERPLWKRLFLPGFAEPYVAKWVK